MWIGRGADLGRPEARGGRDDRSRGLWQVGISEQKFYVWMRKYAGLGLSELREQWQLREENAKLKRLVADLSLDKHMLSEALRKKV